VFFSATPTAALAADQPTGLTDYLRGLFRYKWADIHHSDRPALLLATCRHRNQPVPI